MADKKVSGDMVINDVVMRYPWTLPVFYRLGVDSCCGGARTIAAMAQEHGYDLDAVIAELKKAAEDSRA